MDRGKRARTRRRTVDVLIVGAGPAGLAAGASLARYGRRVLVLDSRPPGGQARRLPVIENYPGCPDGVSGARLMDRFLDQARLWGARVEQGDVVGIRRHGRTFRAQTVGGERSARAVILATGSSFRSLGLEREWGLRGVLHGGVAEAPRLRGRVCVVGGGETAAYQALAASRLATVTLVCRSRRLSVHALLRRRIDVCARVKLLTGLAPARLHGRAKLTAVDFEGAAGSKRVPADWLLILVGKRPRRALGHKAQGPGLFWAGDVRLGRYRQVAIAAGDGVRAAMDCELFLHGDR